MADAFADLKMIFKQTNTQYLFYSSCCMETCSIKKIIIFKINRFKITVQREGVKLKH